MGGHDYFEGKEPPGDKNQKYKLFCKKVGFKYFLKTIISKFKKKQTIFFKIIAKYNFFLGGGNALFSGNGSSDDKNEYNLFYGK